MTDKNAINNKLDWLETIVFLTKHKYNVLINLNEEK